MRTNIAVNPPDQRVIARQPAIFDANKWPFPPLKIPYCGDNPATESISANRPTAIIPQTPAAQ